MKNVMTYSGQVLRIERLASSVNGNPRFAYTVGNPGTGNQVTACTTPDSSYGYMTVREGDRVRMSVGEHYGRLQIDAIVVLGRNHDKR